VFPEGLLPAKQQPFLKYLKDILRGCFLLRKPFLKYLKDILRGCFYCSATLFKISERYFKGLLRSPKGLLALLRWKQQRGCFLLRKPFLKYLKDILRGCFLLRKPFLKYLKDISRGCFQQSSNPF
jgi:uncharacterized protein YneF (UPF0154 family)